MPSPQVNTRSMLRLIVHTYQSLGTEYFWETTTTVLIQYVTQS